MNYTFMVNDSQMDVFFNDIGKNPAKKIAGTVSFWKYVKGKHTEFIRTVRVDDNGRNFFTWDHHKIYMDEFQAYSPDELVKAFSDPEKNIHGTILCHTLQKYGMSSLIVSIRSKKMDVLDFGGFKIGLTVRSNHDKDSDFDWVDYCFIPDYLRTPEDGYKLKLIPLDESLRGTYPTEDIYVDSLTGLIRRGKDYKIKVA